MITLKLAPGFALILMTLLASAATPVRALDASTAPADAPDAGAFLGAPTPGALAATSPDRLSPPYHPGWPQTMGTHVNYKPVGVVLADVDADGLKEVLAGSTDNLFRVWRHDGTLMPGWPLNMGGQVQSKAAAADLDGDGDLEILIAVKSGALRVYHHDATPLAGWPQNTNVMYGFLSPVVYDLDGDGRPEVLFGGGTNVQAWRADGTPIFSTNVGANITGTLAVGDVNQDERPEILATTLSGTLPALDAHGVPLPGSPANFGLSTSWAAPSIGDIDADGQNETFVVGYQFGSFTRVYAYRWTPVGPVALAGFPVTYPSAQTYSCPVLADADGDGDLELWNAGKISSAPTFYAWDYTGAVLPGWPTMADYNMEGSAILVDFDGLPGMEAAIGDNWNPGRIFGYNLNGTIATDFPIPKPGASGPNSPEVDDVDGDGLLEMGFTMMTGDVALWDFAVPYADAGVEWGALFHDDWNTNQHGFVLPGGGAGVAEAPAALAGSLRLVPNPAWRTVAIPLALARAENVRLGVYDLQGREVAMLFAGPLAAGQSDFAWDGRDAAGRPVAAGVYRVRCEGAASGVRAARLVVLR